MPLCLRKSMGVPYLLFYDFAIVITPIWRWIIDLQPRNETMVSPVEISSSKRSRYLIHLSLEKTTVLTETMKDGLQLVNPQNMNHQSTIAAQGNLYSDFTLAVLELKGGCSKSNVIEYQRTGTSQNIQTIGNLTTSILKQCHKKYTFT